MTLEDLEEAILKLPPEELAKFRIWFAEFESGMPAAKVEPTAAKLGRLAGRTLAEIRKRTRQP